MSANNLVNVGSCNGLSPVRRRGISWPNVGLYQLEPNKHISTVKHSNRDRDRCYLHVLALPRPMNEDVSQSENAAYVTSSHIGHDLANS